MIYKLDKKKYHDFKIFEENKLPEHSYFIPFSSEAAASSSNLYNERYLSDRVTVLNGKWDFIYFEKCSKMHKSFDTSTVKFSSVDVPSTWQRTGYDQIAYINTRYPFPKRPPKIPVDIPVAVYRKVFNIEENFPYRILTFLGAAGALYVYLNGKYVGYSEGSHNTAEFDISEFSGIGANELVVVLYKWSNGTYLECQDMFRENGIFRDVYITHRKEAYIEDCLLRPEYKGSGIYDLRIALSGRFTHVKVELSKGDNIVASMIVSGGDAAIAGLCPAEWSAERPEIYVASITVYDGERECEFFRQTVGFKHIDIIGEVFKLNDRPIKLLGVNHHDTHPTHGYVMTVKQMEKDISLMKEYNCNAVRMSHYPPDPVMLTMCDIYGLYVIDEADIETHGFYAIPYTTYKPNKLSNNMKWAPHYLDRVKRMYGRDKNHVSVTMWSLGNESGGYKCQDVCYEYLKNVNPQIPVHYEGVTRSKRWAYDVVSHMYASPELMREIAEGKAGEKYVGRPFFQCEYAHAMGVGPGGLDDYVKLFYSSPKFMGGCIWEWADHAVYDPDYKYKWTYGGDHNEKIHDGNFCVDGLFYPDRNPSSGALCMKQCYRPVRTSHIGNNTFTLVNMRSFESTADMEIKWIIYVGGRSIQEGVVEHVIKAGEALNLVLPISDEEHGELYVDFIYTSKVSGLEIAHEQIILSEYIVPVPSGTLSPFKKEGKFLIADNGASQIVIDRRSGEICSYKAGASGMQLINSHPYDGYFGFVPHVYRGVIDNDRIVKIAWEALGLHKARHKKISCRLLHSGGVKVVYKIVSRKILPLAKVVVEYKLIGNTLQVAAKLKKVNPLFVSIPCFGLGLETTNMFTHAEYYARGDAESLSDFNAHAPLGRYTQAISEMSHKYIKPQDSGNRSDLRTITFKGDKCRFRIDAYNNALNVKATRYTYLQLLGAEHIEDIPDCDTLYVSVDGFMRGAGSNSCGPAPSEEHLIKPKYGKPLQFNFGLTFEVEKEEDKITIE